MDGITDKLLHSTVRIDCLNAKGDASSGTGFFYNLTTEGNAMFPVIVTNKHVIKDTVVGIFRINVRSPDEDAPLFGQHVEVPVQGWEAGWVKHPDPEIDPDQVGVMTTCDIFAPNPPGLGDEVE